LEVILNNLQESILDIFKEIKKICDDNDLNYYSIGGTCIGAIRHNGFIPWDDDLDIVMPRADYQKFQQIAPNLLSTNLEILQEKFSDHNDTYFIKVHNKQTTLVQENFKEFKDRYTGVFVDIMPLDGLPNNSIQIGFHLGLLKVLMLLNSYRKEINLSYSNLSKIKKIAIKLLKIFPINFFLDIYLKLVKIYSFDSNSNKLSCFAWSFRAKELILYKEDFSDFLNYKFENTLIRVPIGYDRYLKSHFGNYMVIPESENQVNHGNLIIDLNNSYKDYVNGVRGIE